MTWPRPCWDEMNSPTTAPTKAKPILIRNVAMIAGSVDGTITRLKMWCLDGAIEYSSACRSLSESLAAWYAVMSATIEVSEMASATLDSSPVPNHRMMMGASAILGTELIAAMNGSTSRATNAEYHRPRPITDPMTVPNA